MSEKSGARPPPRRRLPGSADPAQGIFGELWVTVVQGVFHRAGDAAGVSAPRRAPCFSPRVAASAYVLLAASVGLGAAVLEACSEPTTSFGSPEIPGQTNPELVPTPDAGAVVAPVCDGGMPECGVSFAATLYPNLTGSWGCSHGGCHAAGGFPPTIESGDASATYEALSAYTMTSSQGPYAGEPFVLPCSTSPMQSTFLCAVSAPTCGAQQMPLATNGAPPLGTADLASISTWIGCGSPNN